MGDPDDTTFEASVRTVAVYGGTFDPPTRAHVELPLAVVGAIEADHLLVIPAAASPFKPDGPIASDDQRLQMLRFAFAGMPAVTITSMEIERGGASYTVDTLRELKQRHPAITFRLIIGADQAASFHRWREAGAIIEAAEPAVMLRGNEESAEDLLQRMAPHWSDDDMKRWESRIVSVPATDASSTEARALLSASTPESARLSELLDPAVLGYIREVGLYGSSADH